MKHPHRMARPACAALIAVAAAAGGSAAPRRALAHPAPVTTTTIDPSAPTTTTTLAPRPASRVEDVLDEVPVTATFLTNQVAQNSPALAVDPTNAKFVALASRIDGPRDFDCSLAVSGDGGRSWLPARPIVELPAGVEHCYAPELAFDRAGRLYYLFVGLAGAGNSPVGAYLTSSDDRGRTFQPAVQVLGPKKYAVRMAIDRDFGPRGRIHLVWLAPSGDPSVGALPSTANPILAAHSDDGGRTFSTPVTVSDPARRLVVAPALTVGKKGKVHVVYYDLMDDRRDYEGLEGPAWDGIWSLVSATSDDGGVNWKPGVVISGDVVPPERVMLIFTMPAPAVATGPKGELYASWWDGHHGDWDVFLARSADAGASWADPERVNDDPIGNGRHQYMPRLSVAPGGRVDLVFYDRRDDVHNVQNNLYYSYSEDGGEFVRNRRVTAQGFFSDTGPTYPIPSAQGLVEFGSRIALTSQGSGVLAAWTDTRLTPRGLEHQDIFATEVDLAGRSRERPPLVFGGMALALAAVVVAAVVRTRQPRTSVIP